MCSRNISRIRCYLTEPATQMLVHSLVTCLDYCNSLLYGVPRRTLQRVQNAAVRLVARSSCHPHITQLFGSYIGFLWSTMRNSRSWYSHSRSCMGKLLPTSETCYTWPNLSECCGLSVPLLWKCLLPEVWSMAIGLLVQLQKPSGVDYLL